jgi:hypothetical protein
MNAARQGVLLRGRSERRALRYWGGGARRFRLIVCNRRTR